MKPVLETVTKQVEMVDDQNCLVPTENKILDMYSSIFHSFER